MKLLPINAKSLEREGYLTDLLHFEITTTPKHIIDFEFFMKFFGKSFHTLLLYMISKKIST